MIRICIICLFTICNVNANCAVLTVPRRDRNAQCWKELHNTIALYANESHTTPLPEWTHHEALDGHTILFAGSSHTRTMLLDFLLFITGTRPNSHLMASRQYFCKNQDGMDIDNCGWPSSAQWLLQRNAILEHTLLTKPTKVFPNQPKNDQWRIVFQFKTFVSTPRIDRQIIRQLYGYNASCLVLEVGIWGFLSQEGSLEDQAWSLLFAIRESFIGSIILIIDGYHSGMIGPHVVTGKHIAPTLRTVANYFGDIFVFDRTESLNKASKCSFLASSMAEHGYAGTVATRHVLSLFNFISLQ
jgi:hypothetical protein